MDTDKVLLVKDDIKENPEAAKITNGFKRLKGILNMKVFVPKKLGEFSTPYFSRVLTNAKLPPVEVARNYYWPRYRTAN